MSTSTNEWLKFIPDTTLISEINLPGTHDSAAISDNPFRAAWTNQDRTITEQLNGGVRILDVRLKVRKTGENKIFKFITCHGDVKIRDDSNEFQDFASLMTECVNFLNANKSEFIVMTLKIDDWFWNEDDRLYVLSQLEREIDFYKIALTTSDLPTLGEVRGKILLLNRITDTQSLGAPIDWDNATPGMYARGSRNYNLYVQDKWKGFGFWNPPQEKCDLVFRVFSEKRQGEILLNFTTGVTLVGGGIYIMRHILYYFGQIDASQRRLTFGWLMFDRAFRQYYTNKYGWVDIVKFIISSNFRYEGFEGSFNVHT